MASSKTVSGIKRGDLHLQPNSHQNHCQSFKNPSVNAKRQSLLNVQMRIEVKVTYPTSGAGSWLGTHAAHAPCSSSILLHQTRSQITASPLVSRGETRLRPLDTNLYDTSSPDGSQHKSEPAVSCSKAPAAVDTQIGATG